MTDYPAALDAIEARLKDRLDRLPALDERPMTDQLEDGLAQMRRAVELFEDADDVAEIVSYYALVWTHKFGPLWDVSDEGRSLLGTYRVGHADMFAGRESPIEHTRRYYRYPGPQEILEAHLTIDHGFDHATQWTTARLLAAHAAVHHVLPQRVAS